MVVDEAGIVGNADAERLLKSATAADVRVAFDGEDAPVFSSTRTWVAGHFGL